MSSDVCTQALPTAKASSKALFRDGMSFPAFTTCRPSFRYSSGHSLSTYQVGTTPASLYNFWMRKMSVMPSTDRVRKPETTVKWISFTEGMSAFSSAERPSKSNRSASGPVIGSFSTSCHALERLPATYAALGPSSRFSTRPSAMVCAFSSSLAKHMAPTASSSFLATSSAAPGPAGTSRLMGNFKQALGSRILWSSSRRSLSGRSKREWPFSMRRSKTTMVPCVDGCKGPFKTGSWCA
mmetsp:Transcript_34922/g.96448  ORF Transcript_34922/g.96448 Transcript_34922/m.96448 type:complete len:239 (+) Transcript_34922:636-1352(+)